MVGQITWIPSHAGQSKESDAFASQGVERLIRPLLNPRFGPYRTGPELDLGVMPTHDVLLVGLRGGRPRIVNLERDDYLCRPSKPGRELPVERE